jgi:divalent metal cation (Fe/Co/Zn/Cd) transporter
VTAIPDTVLLRRGIRLEYATLAWNVVGSVIVLIAALPARSVALAGFGLDSLIEIVASLVVVWQLKGIHDDREQKAMRIIGVAFLVLAAVIAIQSSVVLATGFRPHHSPLGIAWLALTAGAMFALAYGKHRTGRGLGNRVLQTEARVTLIDGYLASAVLVGLAPERGRRLVVGRPPCRLRDCLLRPCRRTLRPARLTMRSGQRVRSPSSFPSPYRR